MGHPPEQTWTFAATAAVLTLIGALLRHLARRGRYPELPEPDPAQPDTTRDRLRYYLANALALGLGLLAGAALWAVPPLAAADVLWRHSTYDSAGGRMIGPLFVLLSVAGLTVVPFAQRLVAPGPLLHILTRSAKRQRAAGVDLRPFLRWLSLIVLPAAILLHIGIRNDETTFDGHGVQWRNWPWQANAVYGWQELADVRLVRTFEAMTGRIVERPHLSLEFRDGQILRLGKSSKWPEAMWEEAAVLVSTRSGLPVRRLERE